MKIIADTHQRARLWAARNGHEAGNYSTLTLACSLRGLNPQEPIVILDVLPVPKEYRAIHKALERFKNVRVVPT